VVLGHERPALARPFLAQKEFVMSEQENIRLSDEAYAALNSHDLSRFAQALAEDFQAGVPDVPATLNKQQYLDYLQNYLTGFPDMHFEVERTIAKDDTVVTLWAVTGTNTGPLHGPNGMTIPPTGRKFTNRGTNTLDNKNGKAVRLFSSYDLATLMQQLGLMPNA
jgi:steroid delta-isomerase-like uncharacterized protein